MPAATLTGRAAWSAALALALLAALTLAACDAGATSKRDTDLTAPRATATPPPSDWTVVSGANVAKQAPDGIRTVYAGSGQGGFNALHRSDDGGATWHFLPWPHIIGAVLPADIEDTSVTWNGHMPHTIFADYTLKDDAACPPADIVPIPSINGRPEDSSTTGSFCQLVRVSDDSGESWRPLIMPPSVTGGLATVNDGDSALNAGGLLV